MADGLAAVHRRRLRDIWRSAGWPCQDGIEIEARHHANSYYNAQLKRGIALHLASIG